MLKSVKIDGGGSGAIQNVFLKQPLLGKEPSAKAILGKLTSNYLPTVKEGLALISRNSEAVNAIIDKNEKYPDAALCEAIKTIAKEDSGRLFSLATKVENARIRQIAIGFFSKKPNTELILHSIISSSEYPTGLFAADSLFELEKLGSHLAAQMLNKLFKDSKDPTVREYISQMIRTRAIKEMLKSGITGVRGTGIKALGVNLLAASNVALCPPDEEAGILAAGIISNRFLGCSKTIASAEFLALSDDFSRFPLHAIVGNSRYALSEIRTKANFQSARECAEKTLSTIS